VNARPEGPRYVVCGAPAAAPGSEAGVARAAEVEGVVDVAGVPFAPWAGGEAPREGRAGPGIAGWLLEVPPGRYDVAHVLAASDHDARVEVHLHYEDGDDPEWLHVSSSCREQARYGEPAAPVRTPSGGRVWAARVPVTRRRELWAIRLPERGPVTVVGLTLAGAEDLDGATAGEETGGRGPGSSDD
jgi:hypothetical protein